MILVVAVDVMKMRKRSVAVSLSVVTGNGRVCVGISWQESEPRIVHSMILLLLILMMMMTTRRTTTRTTTLAGMSVVSDC